MYSKSFNTFVHSTRFIRTLLRKQHVIDALGFHGSNEVMTSLTSLSQLALSLFGDIHFALRLLGRFLPNST